MPASRSRSPATSKSRARSATCASSRMRATQFASESHHGEAGLNYTLRLPLGVVGCISPWNLPLYLFTWKIAPALAAGNYRGRQAVRSHPAHGDDAGRAGGGDRLSGRRAERRAWPGLRAWAKPSCGTPAPRRSVSPAAARSVAASPASPGRCSRRRRWNWAARTRPWSSPTATGASTCDTLVRSAFQNSGQICLCGSRLLVERSIHDEFREAFVERVQAIAHRRSAGCRDAARPAGLAGAVRQGAGLHPARPRRRRPRAVRRRGARSRRLVHRADGHRWPRPRMRAPTARKSSARW